MLTILNVFITAVMLVAVLIIMLKTNYEVITILNSDKELLKEKTLKSSLLKPLLFLGLKYSWK